MDSHDIAKALEVWTLQNLLNITIMLGIVACGLAALQAYYQSLEKHLTLRVSIEIWRLLTVLAVDILLAIIVVVGYAVLNPDIMADIKVAVPFVPVATVLFSIALVLRLCYGGHDAGSKSFSLAFFVMVLATVINMVGLSFVMEAPSGEYLASHPSPFWDFIKAHLRSNADPHGLELAQLTFYICFPLLVLVFAWGFWSAFARVKQGKGE